jgi:pyruvate dehydrogenase E1 component beta subunit
MTQFTYGEAIREGFDYLMGRYPEVFTIGQGVWSPWYVGSSMTDLDLKYGKERVIDTPVSELGTTGMCVGAALMGMRPICVHPRMDFAILCLDAIVNQAAKWSHMFGGQSHVPMTVRMIINRGGEQGAQHSQALHSWLMHIPGLRVVIPFSVQDARDLLIAATLCNDPVVYIDDRWLYENQAELPPVQEEPLECMKPKIVKTGNDITLVGAGWTTQLCLEAANKLQHEDIQCEVIDLRVLNPLDPAIVIQSVLKTKRLLVVDGSWSSCGLSAEIIASVMESVDPKMLKTAPKRLTLPSAPAPTSRALEDIYYPTSENVYAAVRKIL